MKVQKVFVSAAVSLVVLAGLAGGVPAAEKQAVQGTEQRMEKAMAMPLLRGAVWQKMTQDEKIAFLWGAAHVIVVEREMVSYFPQLENQNFSMKVAQGMPHATMNDIARRVDEFYAAHPAQLDEPVVAVIWDEMVKPNLKTGIAGRPLK